MRMIFSISKLFVSLSLFKYGKVDFDLELPNFYEKNFISLMNDSNKLNSEMSNFITSPVIMGKHFQLYVRKK